MEPAFLAMAIASGLHAVEEYLYPGGFLSWLHSVFPRTAPGSVGAIIFNGVFFCLVLSPLFSNAQRTPIFSLSIAGLLLANGALHVIGTLVTRRYSPGTVTSVFCYLPTSVYSLLTVAPKWHMGVPQVIGAISLGVLWQLLPLGVMARRSWR
ncbi:MAG: HXXEE domain-containing protein [Verrucomicrobia bacterium]|nr:HXXEE domain-containing protein [Verrucomicrobiota bacterium]MBV8484900.1 HXXEE domain-containing protein [Verrucomicrobiota bacterium]